MNILKGSRASFYGLTLYRKNLLLLCFLFSFSAFSFSAYPDVCQFKGKVTPEEKKDLVEFVYRDICEWWKKTMKKPLYGDMDLKMVEYVPNWDSPKWPDYIKGNTGIYGLFRHMSDPFVHEVSVLDPLPNDNTWKKGWHDLVSESILAHEIFHFFQKNCCYYQIKKVQKDKDIAINNTLYEAAAYWAQNEYLKRNHGVKLTDLMILDSEYPLGKIEGFEEISSNALFSMLINFENRIHNSILWFDEDPVGKLRGLVNGKYVVYINRWGLE